jgi:hypothetical protein
VIRVWDAEGLLGAAVAELPMTAAPAEGPVGAVVVTAGCETARAALASGAAGIVLAEPGQIEPEPVAELAAASGDRPVLVVRGRLRDHPPADAAVLVAECAAPSAELGIVLRDTLGWLRLLTGREIGLRAATGADGGILALLDAGGTPASVLARSLSGVPDGGVIRVTALGSDRVEVFVDEPAGVLRMGTEQDSGTTVAPRLLETPERATLRRIAAALDTGERPDDLAGLLHDVRLARAIIGAPG